MFPHLALARPARRHMRREHALARYVLSRRPEIQFSFFDKPTLTFLAIGPAWIERLIGWEHAIDMAAPDVRRGRRRRLAGDGRVPLPLPSGNRYASVACDNPALDRGRQC